MVWLHLAALAITLVVAWVFKFYTRLGGYSKEIIEFECVSKLPSIAQVFPDLILGAIFKKQGVTNFLTPSSFKVLVQIGPTLICPKQLRSYAAHCGHPIFTEMADEVLAPPCYLAACSFLQQPKIVSLPKFPVSPLKLILIKVVIEQYYPIIANSKISFETVTKDINTVERGLQIEIETTAKDHSKCTLWTCTQTLLSPKGLSIKKTSSLAKPYKNSKIINVPECTGRDYAKLTGDYNFQHINRFTAALFGFKKPIAHGMWSLERTLSYLSNIQPLNKYPFHIECSFKKPLFIPSDVQITWQFDDEKIYNPILYFSMWDAQGYNPHLLGTLQCTSTDSVY